MRIRELDPLQLSRCEWWHTVSTFKGLTVPPASAYSAAHRLCQQCAAHAIAFPTP